MRRYTKRPASGSWENYKRAFIDPIREDDKKSKENKTMSIWEKDESLKAIGETTGDENPWLRWEEGEKKTLKWINIERQSQKEDTPEEYKSPDGMQYFITFQDLDGMSKWYTCNTKTKTGRDPAILVGMKKADVQPGDTITIERSEDGFTYTVERVEEIKKESNPEDEIVF